MTYRSRHPDRAGDSPAVGVSISNTVAPATEVAAAFRRAATTLRALDGGAYGPRKPHIYWPGVKQPVRRTPERTGSCWTSPAPTRLDELDQVLAWMERLDLTDREIYFARLCGVPWRLIAKRHGRSRQALHNRLLNCFKVIAIAVCDSRIKAS